MKIKQSTIKKLYQEDLIVGKSKLVIVFAFAVVLVCALLFSNVPLL